MSFRPADYDFDALGQRYVHHQTGAPVTIAGWKQLVACCDADEVRRGDEARISRAAKRLAASHAARLTRIGEAAGFDTNGGDHSWDELAEYVIARLKATR